jgi:hypothetical protein
MEFSGSLILCFPLDASLQLSDQSCYDSVLLPTVGGNSTALAARIVSWAL